MEKQQFLNKFEELKSPANAERWAVLQLWLVEAKSDGEIGTALGKDRSTATRKIGEICKHFGTVAKGKKEQRQHLVLLFRRYCKDFEVHPSIYPDWVDGDSSDRPQSPTNSQNIPTPEPSPELTTLEFIGRDRQPAVTNHIASEDMQKLRLIERNDASQSEERAYRDANHTVRQLQPDHFNVPNPSRYFKGRDPDLDNLWQTFSSTNCTSQVQVITGMGGMGKTQLAIQYAHLHKQDYRLIRWLRAESPVTLAEDFATLAIGLNLPEKDADDQNIRINAVKRSLSLQNGWLLIFDNAQNLKDIEPYLLYQASGHILVTSQKQSEWRSRTVVFPLSKLSLNDAIAFLLEQTGQKDTYAAHELAQKLDGLPLALAQASAYIDRTSCTIQAYLNLYQTCQTQLLNLGFIETDYNLTVATTWQLAFEKISANFPAAVKLLNMCAFLDPDNIPEVLFLQQTEDVQIFTSPLEFDEAIATLRDYSLIERGEDLLSIHRLVQTVTINRMSKSIQEELVESLLHQLKKYLTFDYYDKNIWAIFKRYLPHANVAIDHANNLAIVNSDLIIIQSNIGQYLIFCGRVNEAELHLTTSIKNTEKLTQTQKLLCRDLEYLLIESYHNLSSVYQEKSQFEKMVDCHTKEVDLCVKLYGENHFRTISARRCLGCSYIHKGELNIGEQIVLQALELSKAKHQNTSKEKAFSNTLLGVVMSKRKEWNQAIFFYKLAESQFSDAGLNETHHAVGVIYYRMMQAYEALGDLIKREEYFIKSRTALKDSQLNHLCNLDFKELRRKLGLPELS
jgi:tetratricopeptide (TPR) repeat protein